LVPGEIEARCRKDRLVNGIPLPSTTMDMLTELSRECGLEF
jgi:LDH2 family malate/lactate/ureidoglycolate dehydrogenase